MVPLVYTSPLGTIATLNYLIDNEWIDGNTNITVKSILSLKSHPQSNYFLTNHYTIRDPLV